MRFKHKDVEVRISRRTLWVDDDAYPLSQVTRVRPIEVSPNRRRIVTTNGLLVREATSRRHR